jgi:HD superfamily phosphohydrolase
VLSVGCVPVRSSSMAPTILDPLYGPIPHRADRRMAWELYQTRPLSRLRDISLSSVPSRMQPTGQASSRFEHSVGVSVLADLLCAREEFRPFRGELIAAALLHDAASAPFSHTAEIFQFDATGLTHEQSVANLLDGRTEIGRILRAYGIPSERVLALINGEHPVLNGILAGSMDLDNADNTLRLLNAIGGLHDRQPPYDPRRLVEAFQLAGEEIVLDSNYLKEMLGWVETRQMLYGEVLYQETNMAAASMLYRALEYAYSEESIDASFFDLGESDALSLLSRDAPAPARRLVESALRWQFYRSALQWTPRSESQQLIRLGADWQARKRFADELAGLLELKPEHLCVHAGRDKGTKPIHLRFVGEHADACQALFGRRGGRQRLSVYIAAEQEFDRTLVRSAAMDLLDRVEPLEQGHTFF